MRQSAAWSASTRRADRGLCHRRVSGSSRVGGLVGRNQSTGSILASYATAYVSGTSDAGGLAGTGTGTGTASYWDTSTSGRTVGAAGRTMAALQSPTGYTGIYSQWNVVTNCGLPHSAQTPTASRSATMRRWRST